MSIVTSSPATSAPSSSLGSPLMSPTNAHVLDIDNLSSVLSVLGDMETTQLTDNPGAGDEELKDAEGGDDDDDEDSDNDERRLEEARRRLELASELVAKEKEDKQKLKAVKRRAPDQDSETADLEHTDHTEAVPVNIDESNEEPPNKKNRMVFAKHPGFIMHPEQDGVAEGMTKVLSTTLSIANVADLKMGENRLDVTIKALFSKFGAIELVTVVKDIGFVKFRERAAAEEALDGMQGHQLDNGSQLQLSWGRGKPIKEENFDLSTGEATVATNELPAFCPSP